MKYIKHRLNRIADLESIESREWGCEIDLRSDVNRPDRLLLSHDPWAPGEDFDAWLEAYVAKSPAGTLILNTKEDGLEEAALRRMRKHSIENFFFLDTAFPTLIKWSLGKGMRNFALRLSAHERVDGHPRLVGGVDWLWIDCFDRQPLSVAEMSSISIANKVLVSPELQGGDDADFPRFLELARACTHICTKRPGAWASLLGPA